jgi:hypothetical protein
VRLAGGAYYSSFSCVRAYSVARAFDSASTVREDETDIIAGITITGDALCKSTNVIYRLDTESARAFLEDFVALP